MTSNGTGHEWTPATVYDHDRGRWMLFEYGRWRPATAQEKASLPAPDLGRQRGRPDYRFAWIPEDGLGWTLLDADGYRTEPWT